MNRREKNEKKDHGGGMAGHTHDGSMTRCT